MASATFNGGELTIPAGGNPVWVKAGGMTIQITPAGHGDCDHLTVDVWRDDDPAMAEPWTVVFDGESARIA